MMFIMLITVAALASELGALSKTGENPLESFRDSQRWKRKYKLCNPKKNAYTSPIDITSSRAQLVREMEALMVHSKKPQEDIYVFSTMYDADNVRMESFNIKPRDEEVIRNATQISGLGSSNRRFFKTALIMFRPGNDEADEPLSEHQSLHNIDEKEYQMEIVLNFESHSEKTQIHVMVDVEEQENPVWKPILDTFVNLLHKTIHEICLGDKLAQQVQANFTTAGTLRKEALLQEKNETKGLTYKRIDQEFGRILDNLQDISNETLVNLTKSQLDSLVRQHNCKQELTGATLKLQKIEAEIDRLSASADPSIQANLTRVKAEKKVLQNKRQSSQNCMQHYGAKAGALQKEWSRQTAILKQSRVGNESNDLFQSVDDIAALLNKTQEKQNALEKIEEAYKNALAELEIVKGLSKIIVTITDPFQISWLFPHFNGFYFYNGSSPTPPCEKRSHVIVFEKSITIGVEQLKMFREFPSFDQKTSTNITKLCELKEQGKGDDSDEVIAILTEMEKIKLQMPLLSHLGNRTVWYNPKNTQFLNDDGLHMESTLRRKLKDATSKNLAGVGKTRLFWMWVFFVVIITINVPKALKLN